MSRQNYPNTPLQSAASTSWSDIKFGPSGLYTLRQHIGTLEHARGIYLQHQDRFFASDIAWFASGCHKDGRHQVPSDHFYPDYLHNGDGSTLGQRNELRSSTRELLFDLATLSDHSFAGSTLVVQVDGTSASGTRYIPEHLKAHVYLPQAITTENPECHSTIAHIVQLFLESIGTKTVARWHSATKVTPGFNWSFNYSSEPTRRANPSAPLMPPPTAWGASSYVFLGQPHGYLSMDSDSCAHMNCEQKLVDLQQALEDSEMRSRELTCEVDHLQLKIAELSMSNLRFGADDTTSRRKNVSSLPQYSQLHSAFPSPTKMSPEAFTPSPSKSGRIASVVPKMEIPHIQRFGSKLAPNHPLPLHAKGCRSVASVPNQQHSLPSMT
ncbi:hypothetical protein BD779DRAFT_1679392 [Infundibulicybe gibba]|nr:hypothetical protein BD779DRAFT_1679392 [Infundibulicybe gibba]